VFIDGGIMEKPENTAEDGIDIATGFPTPINQNLVQIYASREQIDEIAQVLNLTPHQDIVKDLAKVQTIELQIADVIKDLETLSENPLGKRFNKRPVLKHLNNARVELNTASLLAADTDTRTKILGFEHVVKCRDYLNLAKDLIPSKED
jgi:hypothetical protein